MGLGASTVEAMPPSTKTASEKKLAAAKKRLDAIKEKKHQLEESKKQLADAVKEEKAAARANAEKMKGAKQKAAKDRGNPSVARSHKAKKAPLPSGLKGGMSANELADMLLAGKSRIRNLKKRCDDQEARLGRIEHIVEHILNQ